MTEKEINDRIYNVIQGFIDANFKGGFTGDGLAGGKVTDMECAILSKLLALRARYSNCDRGPEWADDWENSSEQYLKIHRGKMGVVVSKAEQSSFVVQQQVEELGAQEPSQADWDSVQDS